MVSVKINKVWRVFCAAASIAALAFCACEKVPDNCGNGYPLNAETQFCFGGQTYDKCRGATYDPTANKCESGVLKNKCGGSNWYDPATEFCSDGKAYPMCGGQTYNPASQTCEHGVLKTRCGDNYYTPATEFCSGGKAYAKCGGLTFDPENQTCQNNVVKGKCGDNLYDPATHFCNGSTVTPITNTLIVIASPTTGGTVSRAATTGTTFSIKAEANDGYEFVNWTVTSGNAEIANPTSATTTIELSSNAAVTANFQQSVAPPQPGTTYTLTVNRSPTEGGNVTVNGGSNNPAQSTHNAGAQIIVTATPNSGYTFQNWTAVSGALPQGVTATSASNTFAISGNVNIRANFQQTPPCTFRVSRNIDARGSVSVTVSGFATNNPTAALVYNAGTPVTLTATAVGGKYPFQNWSAVSGALPQGVAATDEEITFNISGSVNIQARFGLPAPDVTTFTDERDGKTYKQVTIGSQTWMAENLNSDIPGVSTDVCYNNADSNCVKYGRLYDWSTMMAGAASSGANPSGVQGICPFGWHIPSDAEWTQLTDFVGGADSAGTMLKSNTGWNSSSSSNINGADDYGFSVLPGGYSEGSSSFYNVGNGGRWWSATESHYSSSAWYWSMSYGVGVNNNNNSKNYRYSVRCVAD